MATSRYPDSARYDLQTITTSFSNYDIYTAGHGALTIFVKNGGASAFNGMQLIGFVDPDTASTPINIATVDGDFTINNSTGLIKFTTSATPTTLASGSSFTLGFDCSYFQKIRFSVKSAGTSSANLLFYLN